MVAHHLALHHELTDLRGAGGLPQQVAWYVDTDGALDVAGLIAAFQEFFREHSEPRRAA